MNVGKMFAAGTRERVFQLKAKRDAGTDAPRWQAPQFLMCKSASAAPPARSGPRASTSAPTAATTSRSAATTA